MTFVELVKESNFDPCEVNPRHFFTQAGFYGKWHEALGRKVFRFLVKDGESPVLFAQVIKFPLPFGKSFLYIPYGPVCQGEVNKEVLDFVREKFLEVLKREGSIFLRSDNSFPLGKKVKSYGASGYFQPREEWEIDLTKGEDQILTEMDKDHRYSIRTAEKRGVSVNFEENILEHFESFYALLTETARRNKFLLSSKEYYRAIFENISLNKNGFLAIAKSDDEILAMNLIIWHSNSAHYLLGSSSSRSREKMPTYLLQWETIKRLKQAGIERYNLGGVDSWESLAKYKKGFGGSLVDHGDMYDLVGNSIWYFLYKMRKIVKR